MAFRFRKSISICPGVRINLGKTGLSSLSVGPRGASVSIGKRGTHANIGIPGTGLSYRTRLNSSSENDRQQNSPKAIEDQALIQYLENIESEMRSILNIHTETPNINNAISFDRLRAEYISMASNPFSVIEPTRPEKPIIPPKPELKESWLGGFFSSNSSLEQKKLDFDESIRRWETQNVKDQTNYVQQRSAWATDYAMWKKQKENFQLASVDSDIEILKAFESDDSFFESKIEHALSNTKWPRETNVSFEVESRNSVIKVAIDLPEIEDIPNSNYKLNKRGTEILEKSKSAKQLRLEYARLVHGIIFRVAGIAFFNLPFNSVEISGFTQRLDKATGYITDDYIIDVRINRDQFLNVNYDRLDMINPIDTLEIFQLTRNMTATGIFKSLNKK